MKKFILLLLGLISILAINTVCVHAKEPDKVTFDLYLDNDRKPWYVGYVIEGEYYYSINNIFAINNSRNNSKYINVTYNESENCIEAYYVDKFTTVPTEHIANTKPTVIPFDVILSATNNLEKDPDEYRREIMSIPRKGAVKIKPVNGECETVTRYAINDIYYYNIKDLAKLLECRIDYSENMDACFLISGSDAYSIQYSKKEDQYFIIRDADKIFKILPDLNYVHERFAMAYGYGMYSFPFWHYIYDNGDDTFSTFGREVQSGEGGVFNTIHSYTKSDFSCIDEKRVYTELDYYCGFFSGEKYNYIGYGAYNPEETPNKEIIRIVKYDKNFNRISSLSLTTEQCYAIAIADAGTMRMAENGSELVVHTSRLRRKTNDGFNHQSQLSLVIDTDTMTVKNYTGEFQSNHVSHSFDQFVQYDGDEIVYIDHGDAYPRAIVLNSSTGKKINLYKIPGPVGENYTGVSVGGFEVSSENYLVTFNTIDFTGMDENTISTENGNERSARLAVCNKNTHDVRIISLNNVFGEKIYTNAPFLVKVNDNRFVLLWTERKTEDGFYTYNTKYVQVDGNGNFLDEIKASDKPLPEYMQPMYMDNAVYWYFDSTYELFDKAEIHSKGGRLFYKIDLDPFNENPISVIYNGEKIGFDQNPIIENGRTLVPLRAIFETLGATVDWDGATQTVTATKDSTKISLAIDNTLASKNGENISLDVPAKIVNGRTLVPVRFIADCFGVRVDWDGNTRKVILTSNK